MCSLVEPATTEPIRLRWPTVVAAASGTVLVIAMGTFPNFFRDRAVQATAALSP